MPTLKTFLLAWGEAGKNIYCIFRRVSDGHLLNHTTGDFASAPANPYVPATEDAAIKGRYSIGESRSIWNDGLYEFYFYKQSGGNAAPVSDVIVGSGVVEISQDNFRMPASVGDAMTLTPAYDAAKSAASQVSVDAIPKNPLLETDPRLQYLDAAISTRLAAAGYTAPDNAGVGAVRDAITDVAASQVALMDIVAGLPTVAAPTVAAIREEMDASSGKLSLLTGLPQLQDIVAGILDAAVADHVAPGTVGEKISQESAPLVIPLVPGTPSVVELASEKTYRLRRGDTYRLTFSLGRDCTGWAAWFGAKKSALQENYDMALRQAVFSDEASGTGYIDLSSDDTAVARTYYGELELRKDGSCNTAEAYKLIIVDDIVR